MSGLTRCVVGKAKFYRVPIWPYVAWLQLQHEKVGLESRVEVEQEYVVNKLRKQMAALQEERDDLERSLRVEHEALEARLAAARLEREALSEELSREHDKSALATAALRKQLEDLRHDRAAVERRAETDQERIANRLQAQIDRVRWWLSSSLILHVID